MTIAPKDNATTTKAVNATNPVVRLLQGIRVPPGFVGTARGIVAAMIIGALEVLVHELGLFSWGQLAVVYAPTVLVIRALEGMVDQKIDPNQNRLPPPAPVPPGAP